MELLERHLEIALETPDGIKKLRELILSLAMQGKLVPQEPNDQPASELLKEIEAEKKKLIKEGKIKKQESFQMIKPEEIPYEVPKGWEWERLGNVGETNIGLTYKPSDISDKGTPVLRSSNIQNGKLDFTDLVRVNTEIKNSALVKEGDLLICARNGSRALVGKTALITGLSEEMAFGAFMAIFRSRINLYLLYFINSPLFRNMIAEVNTMTINQITQNNLKSTIFPLPPLAEQKRIVAKIGQLMALCDKLEVERNERNQKRLTIHTAGMNRLLSSPHKIDFSTSWEFITKNFSELYSVPKNVEELKKAILQLAVMGKLVPQDPNDQPASELLKEIEAEKKRLIKEGKIKKQEPLPSIKPEEIPYEVPKGWEWRFLADICFKITDGFHNTPKKLDTGKIYISATHIREQGIRWNECLFVSEKDHDELFKKAYPQRGEILITNRGAGCGTPAIIDINGEFSFQNAAIIGFNQEKIYNKFVFYYLILNRDHIVQHFVSGGMQPMLSNVTLSTIPFPIPPITEQKRIVAKIDQLMELCNSLGQQIKDSTEKQTAILNAVFARV